MTGSRPGGHEGTGGHEMKSRYDVSRLAATCSARFEDLREAFEMAKAMAQYEGEEIALRKLTWDDTNRVTGIETVLVSGAGQFRYI